MGPRQNAHQTLENKRILCEEIFFAGMANRTRNTDAVQSLHRRRFKR
jgi:hypothetical protein